MEYARDEVPETKHFSFPSDLIRLIIESETIFGGYNISLERYNHDINSITTNIFIGSTRQPFFADESLGLNKTKRYRVILVEEVATSY